MERRLAALRQSDLTRYAKALRAAGYEEWRIKAEPDGTHTIVVGKSDSNCSGPDPDELLT